MSLSSLMRGESKRHEAEMTHIKGLLRQQIDSLPDNPKIIKRFGTAYSISSQALLGGASWSATYHDFKAQYQILIKLCDESKDVRRTLLVTLSNGWVMMQGAKVLLHPDVIKKVRGILLNKNQ